VITETPSNPPAASPPAVKVKPSASNPITRFVDFLGSANVQKNLGLAQVIIAAATNLEGTNLWQHISGMTVGAVFALGVHYFDYLRTK